MRCFIAVPISNELKENIFSLTTKLKPFLTAKFVEKEHLHLTISFLGDLREADMKNVKEKINNVKASRFSIKLHGLNCFPSPTRARVLWVGITDGKEQLEALLNNFGETKPHITIARFKNPLNITETVKQHSNHSFGEMEINEIVIFKAFLRQKVQFTNNFGQEYYNAVITSFYTGYFSYPASPLQDPLPLNHPWHGLCIPGDNGEPLIYQKLRSNFLTVQGFSDGYL